VTSAAPRVGRRLFCAGLATTASAGALGRTPFGGVLRMVVPWSLERIDPHAPDDPVAALFGAAIADPLYAVDPHGRAYSALAEALPKPVARGFEVRLRPGLITARGKALDARDVLASLARARKRGVLVPEARPTASDRLALEFSAASLDSLTDALASPLAAILPRNYSPLEPDGTGAFLAELARGKLVLKRNAIGARGPGYLDALEVATVTDLAEALRAFEAGSVDLGWLGAGLHQARRNAQAFRGTGYGWAVLRTGKRAGSWSAPGVAQKLLDGVDPERLRHLGLEELSPIAASAIAWGGGNTQLLVADDAPQLVLIARSLAALLQRPGHDIAVEPLPRTELVRHRDTRDFALLVDFVRGLGPGRKRVEETFLLAENPELAKRPSGRFGSDPRAVCRTLGLGVIGELWVEGAHDAAFQRLSGWQLGNVFRADAV
jgi:peptide/nickel transport system substrate-binding protein